MGKGEPCTIVKEHRPPSQRKHRELELKAGDQVVVVARDKEWWWGIKVRDPALGVTSAVFGWFPAEHGALDSPTAAARRQRSTSSSLPSSTESDDGTTTLHVVVAAAVIDDPLNVVCGGACACRVRVRW